MENSLGTHVSLGGGRDEETSKETAITFEFFDAQCRNFSVPIRLPMSYDISNGKEILEDNYYTAQMMMYGMPLMSIKRPKQ